MAAESAADWFCNLTVNQMPVSTPSALIPIRQGKAMATIVAVAPVWSRKRRAITVRKDSMKSGDIFIQAAAVRRPAPSADGRPSRAPCQHVDDAQRQGRADYDHQGGQNKGHQRHSHKDGKASRA